MSQNKKKNREQYQQYDEIQHTLQLAKKSIWNQFNRKIELVKEVIDLMGLELCWFSYDEKNECGLGDGSAIELNIIDERYQKLDEVKKQINAYRNKDKNSDEVIL